MPRSADLVALRHQFKFLRRGWVIIVVLAALGGAAAAGLTAITAPVYKATATILLRPGPEGSPVDGPAATPDGVAVATQIVLLQSPEVSQAVAEQLGRPPEVAIAGRAGTYLIDISARSTDPKGAAAEANLFAAVVVEGLQGAASSEGPSLEVEAQVPTEPISPSPGRNGVLGVAGGLVLGLVLASLLDKVDDRLRGREDLEAAGVPLLGHLPRVSLRQLQEGPVALLAPGTPSNKAYRALSAKLRLLAKGRPMRCVQVTSATSNEGKTTVLANLAVSLAQAGTRVILVDSDLRRPKLHEAFGLENKVGLSSVVSGQQTLAEVIVPVEGLPLAVLTAGPPPPDVSELLASDRARAVVETLRSNCDILLIDGQRVLNVPDALVVSRYVDAILFVARHKCSTKRQIVQALELLEKVAAPVVGTVLNGGGPQAEPATFEAAPSPQQLSTVSQSTPSIPADRQRMSQQVPR